ncbi:unnamed protein product [Linum tenue]|uniref:Uncharacterized protein n=1 Tax=Linum tenue TaxID=586396 RepID=A0AAV0S5P8_9ROSI|nr:unnamed protein product [Linum tenue]
MTPRIYVVYPDFGPVHGNSSSGVFLYYNNGRLQRFSRYKK